MSPLCSNIADRSVQTLTADVTVSDRKRREVPCMDGARGARGMNASRTPYLPLRTHNR
jgi:hypothetical protein